MFTGQPCLGSLASFVAGHNTCELERDYVEFVNCSFNDEDILDIHDKHVFSRLRKVLHRF